MRRWWIHSRGYDIDPGDWFVEVLIAGRNMWEKDNPKVVEVVEYEPMRMEIIKLECEIARLHDFISAYSKGLDK